MRALFLMDARATRAFTTYGLACVCAAYNLVCTCALSPWMKAMHGQVRFHEIKLMVYPLATAYDL